MSTTVSRPPPKARPITIAAIAIVAVLAATFGTLLLFGVFDDNGTEAPRSTAPAVQSGGLTYEGATNSGGIEQARTQREEHLVQHGAPIAGTGGATRYGDTKYDLAHPEDRAHGDTKHDLQNTQDLGVAAAKARAYEPTTKQVRDALRIERHYMSGEEGAGH